MTVQRVSSPIYLTKVLHNNRYSCSVYKTLKLSHTRWEQCGRTSGLVRSNVGVAQPYVMLNRHASIGHKNLALNKSFLSMDRGRSTTRPAVPVDVLAAVAPVCFTKECQAEADRVFLLAVTAPVLLAAAAAAYIARPPPQELKDSGQIFEDDSTGSVFESPAQQAEPERDKDGLLVFRAFSYTPQPVPSDSEGERLRIPVGPVRERKPRTYVFSKVLRQPSEVITVTLPRPLGVVFEYDPVHRRALVVEVVEGSAAAQRSRLAGLNPGLATEAVKPGDVLRGTTCTNFVYPTKALFGAVPPERHVVVYGADKQSWASIRAALRKGEVKDGQVTLVLERPLLRQ